MRKILITNALPYGNGELHVGHLLGYINADIWARFQRLIGNNCLHICGTDTHGTAIMIAADKLGISADNLVNDMFQKHKQVFEQFNIQFDYYGSTQTHMHKNTINELYATLISKNLIYKAEVLQAFDEKKQMFLPDRFVKGICPFCNTPDQYGDNCDNCGKVYSPQDLINPYSIFTGTKPIFKYSTNYFFDLKAFHHKLLEKSKTYLNSQFIANLTTWFNEGLKDWSISRDAPYYGFPIPDTDKYFYVWFDAPVAYISIFRELAEKLHIDYLEYWDKASTTELYQYIGKDIVYFHALFWPALLMASDKRLPNKLVINGFVTLNKQKMSKSRNIVVSAEQAFLVLGSHPLRYYLASKSNGGMQDINLDLEALKCTINKNLIGKIINIASRSAPFLETYFNNVLADKIEHLSDILKSRCEMHEKIKELYETRNFAMIVREIEDIATYTNIFFNANEPWHLIKTDPNAVHNVCSIVLNIFKILICYLMPIIPTIAEKALKFLNIQLNSWQDITTLMLNHEINSFIPFIKKITSSDIQDILDN